MHKYCFIQESVNLSTGLDRKLHWLKCCENITQNENNNSKNSNMELI